MPAANDHCHPAGRRATSDATGNFCSCDGRGTSAGGGGAAECCLFVDDNPDNVEAGRAAGIDSVLYTSPAQLHRELAARGAVVLSGVRGTLVVVWVGGGECFRW